MKRFLMLVGVAVVAAAMYVAAAPGSQQAKAPTAKQFNALKKQVASLAKTVKAVKTVPAAEAGVITACDAGAAPIDEFGDGVNATPTEGYEYSPTSTANGASTFLTTALDIAPSSDSGAGWFAFGTSSCGSLLNTSALRHAAARAGIQLPRAAAHLPSFAAHRH
jgi:hypothetical protein